MAGRVTATGDASGATVTITVQNTAAAKRMLAQWKDPELTIRATRAVTAGAEVLRRPLQIEAGKVSSRMARAVSIRQAQRDRPAAVVTFNPKIAWFRHFVIGGTRSHGPKRRKVLRFRGRFGWVFAKNVSGVRPNPIIVRVARQYQQRVFDAMVRSLTRQSNGASR